MTPRRWTIVATLYLNADDRYPFPLRVWSAYDRTTGEQGPHRSTYNEALADIPEGERS